MDDPNMDLNLTDNEGCTALYHACERGYIAVVELLVGDDRCDPYKANNQNMAPYDIAVKLDKMFIVDYLSNTLKFVCENAI